MNSLTWWEWMNATESMQQCVQTVHSLTVSGISSGKWIDWSVGRLKSGHQGTKAETIRVCKDGMPAMFTHCCVDWFPLFNGYQTEGALDAISCACVKQPCRCHPALCKFRVVFMGPINAIKRSQTPCLTLEKGQNQVAVTRAKA
jgi:uncharacterized protein YoaH (UPF0181 family)